MGKNQYPASQKLAILGEMELDEIGTQAAVKTSLRRSTLQELLTSAALL